MTENVKCAQNVTLKNYLDRKVYSESSMILVTETSGTPTEHY